jgi:hypothetical protein
MMAVAASTPSPPPRGGEGENSVGKRVPPA